MGDTDLPAINRTSYFSKKSIHPKDDGDENKEIQQRANHWFSEANRSRQANQGTLAQAQAELEASISPEVATVVALGLEAYSGQ